MSEAAATRTAIQAPLVRLSGLRHSFPASGFRLRLDHLEIGPGQKVAVIGRSGCGKTTLLNLIAGIQTPDAGEVYWGNDRIDNLKDPQRRDLRLERMGFVFQDFCLIDYLNLLENILLPYRLSSRLRLTASARERARHLASQVGLQARLGAAVGTLSQGERQRVIICRALVTEPQLVLADEATSNLDPFTRDQIQHTLIADVEARQAALLAVTHDRQTLTAYDRVLDLEGT
ncbi:MAG: ATP-binding cassette domain-containing protein [Synechococcus sp.]|nr:ATP-binding cassette domain-containing protein [Synechococcus sp.]